MHTPRMVPGLPAVRNMSPRQIEQTVSSVQVFQELGTIAGRLVFAFLIVRIATQRTLLRIFLVPGLAVFAWRLLFRRHAQFGTSQAGNLPRGAISEWSV